MSRGAGAPSETMSWTNPANAVTLLRVALVPVIAVLLWMDGEAARWWAAGVFAVAALSDSVDGWVARRLAGSTRWGQLADPVADKVLVVATLAILAVRAELSWLVVAVVVARELAVTVQRSLLAARGIVMPASIYGKVKTVSQLAAITLYLVPTAPRSLAGAVMALAVVATVASGAEYAWRGRRLVRAR